MNANPHAADPRSAPRYVIRTVDEDWIDLFDPPARIDARRPAWEEAQRRVRNHPECTTVVLDRRTGATLWESDPELPRRYVVSAVGDVLSAHKKKDDAWTAFYRAIETPRDDIVVLLEPARCRSRPSSRVRMRISTGRAANDDTGLSRRCVWARRCATGLYAAISASSDFRCNPSRLRSQARCALRLPEDGGIVGNKSSSRRRPIVPHVLTAPTPKGVLHCVATRFAGGCAARA